MKLTSPGYRDYRRPQKGKGNKEDCLYKGEEVFTDCNQDVNSQEIKDACDELDVVLENVMSAMDKLFERYKMDRESIEVLRGLVKK